MDELFEIGMFRFHRALNSSPLTSTVFLHPVAHPRNATRAPADRPHKFRGITNQVGGSDHWSARRVQVFDQSRRDVGGSGHFGATAIGQ